MADVPVDERSERDPVWADDYTGIGDMPTPDLVKLLYLDWEKVEREGFGDVARHIYEAARRLDRTALDADPHTEEESRATD